MKKAVLITCLILTACGADGKYQDYLNIREIPPPREDGLTHCFNYGCQSRVTISLPPNTKKKLVKNFKPLAKNPEKERKQISSAIMILEKDIGAIAGTANDKFGTFDIYQDDSNKAASFQQDCVDESTNTTIYLALLDNLELLKFHKPIFPAVRQPFASGTLWWHQTAVIREIETGQKYAVDSWFEDNGQPAHVLPLTQWKKGWSPRRDKHNASAKKQ